MLMKEMFGNPYPQFVRDGLGSYTGWGRKGQPPHVTHAHLPGATRREKRANMTHAQRLELRLSR